MLFVDGLMDGTGSHDLFSKGCRSLSLFFRSTIICPSIMS